MPISEMENQESEINNSSDFKAYLKEIDNVGEISHKLHIPGYESEKYINKKGILSESVSFCTY